MSGRIRSEGQLDLPMSGTDIADNLGLTIKTVSRTWIERKGIISGRENLGPSLCGAGHAAKATYCPHQ